MVKRIALLGIVLSLAVIGGGYASAFLPGGPPKAATFGFAIAAAVIMTSILVLGAARRDRRLGKLWWVFAFVFVVLAVGFSVALTQTSVSTDRLWLGLPAGAAIILYVVGLMPMVVVPLAYALTFEKTTLGDEELAALRRHLEELKSRSEEAR